MKEKTKQKMLAFILVVAFAILMPFSNVKASLQANPNTHNKKVDGPTNWMSNIRSMEKSGEAMGLSETLNSDLTASSDSNGIDVHMMKSTEYGAIAILSASGYGNPQKLQNSTEKTTTGNKTGVYFSGANWEWVAGGLQGSIFGGVNSKYYDSYTGAQTSAKVGDALGTSAKVGDTLGTSGTTNPGCARWHSASNAGWVGDRYPYFVRDSGGLFSFFNNAGSSNLARGVAVCGAGL